MAHTRLGDTVFYTLTADDATRINTRTSNEARWVAEGLEVPAIVLGFESSGAANLGLQVGYPPGSFTVGLTGTPVSTFYGAAVESGTGPGTYSR